MRHAPAPVFSRTGRRTENEDAVFLHSTTRSSGQSVSLLAVADGMGGHTHGAKASEIAIRVVEDAVEEWMEDPDSLNEDQLRIECRQLFERVDQAIEMYTNEHPDAEGMGTTLVIAVVVEDQVYVAHIGDSRAYWISRDESAAQLTQDHSAAAEAIREGRMSEEEVAESPFQHALTRSLDGSGDSPPDFGVHAIQDPGFLLLCSDGLSGTVDDDHLAEELLRNVPLAASAEALVDAALDQGSEDNISLVALECGTVERKDKEIAPAAPQSPGPSADQPPVDDDSPSQPARDVSPPNQSFPNRAPSTKHGAPRWATMLLGVLVFMTLGLGGWAEYRYDMVGLFPGGTASGNASIIADAGGEAGPTVPDSVGGDSDRVNTTSSPPADSSQAQVTEEEDGSAQPQTNGGPDDLAGATTLADGGGSEESPGGDEGASGSKASSPSEAQRSANQAVEQEEAAPSGETEETADLSSESVKPVPEGEQPDRQIPHSRFNEQDLRVESVEGQDEVGSEITLDSGARVTVEPKGRFSYDPNGTFSNLDAGEDTTDQFTYIAVSESGEGKLEGTVEIPIEGRNTPPEVEVNDTLALGVGQIRTISSDELRVTDPDDKAEEIQFTVTKGPTQGQVLKGDSSASAEPASSFTQRDVNSGRVFYADSAGQTGGDAFTFAVEDGDGEGLKGKTFRISIENCRIQFAATVPVNSEEKLDSDKPEFSSGLPDSIEVTVKDAENEEGYFYGLFSGRSGARRAMEERRKQLIEEGIVNDNDEDGPFVHCFQSDPQR